MARPCRRRGCDPANDAVGPRHYAYVAGKPQPQENSGFEDAGGPVYSRVRDDKQSSISAGLEATATRRLGAAASSKIENRKKYAKVQEKLSARTLGCWPVRPEVC